MNYPGVNSGVSPIVIPSHQEMIMSFVKAKYAPTSPDMTQLFTNQHIRRYVVFCTHLYYSS